MSDYLWDKTGEPDAEIERLEELLGQLCYQPRELQLPLESERPAPARQRAFFHPRLAIAAALALAALAGVWLGVIRHGEDVSSPTEVANKLAEPSPAPTRELIAPVEHPTSSAKDDATEKVNVTVAERVRASHAAQANRRVVHDVPAARQQKRDFNARVGNSEQVASGNQQQPRLSLAEMAEAEQAKEQLMLALHVASAKFNLAEREAPGIIGLSPDIVQQHKER